MRPITFAGFAGSNLAQSPNLLPEAVCASITDAEPGLGDLRPLKAPLAVASAPAGGKSIWRMGRDVPNDANYWFSWSTIVNAILGFDGQDTTERTYFTGSGSPKWTNNIIGLAGGAPYPQGVRELAVPAPIGIATIALTTNGTGNEGTRFYVHTFVNDLGWESAPSPPTAGLFCKAGAIVDIGNLEAAPSGAYGITARRIYVTQPGTGGTADYYFLREIPIGTTSTTDDARTRGDLLATQGWLTPPTDGHGLIALWNGMYALLSGKTLYVSVVPYAYPLKSQFDVFNTAIATVKWEQTLLVLTTGQPVLFQGQDPEGMSQAALALSQPCASARSAVSMGDGAVWASYEGLAYASGEGQALVTGPTPANPKGLITADQWKAMRPDTMIAGRWGRFYVCSYDDGTGRKGFMVDPRNPALWSLSFGFDACHYDELADALYLLQGTSVSRFNAGAALTCSARSKQFAQVSPTNYGWGKVVADAYPVTLKVYADGVLRTTKSVPSRRAFRLPAGFMAEEWQLDVTSTARVQAARLGVNVKDFKGL